MEKNKVPDDKIDEASRSFDKKMEQSKNFNLVKSVTTFLGVLVFNSLFGMIVAAIIKKTKPIFAD